MTHPATITKLKTTPCCENRSLLRKSRYVKGTNGGYMITRRTFVTTTTLALAAFGSMGMFEWLWRLGGTAQADTISMLELEAKGPLDDIPLGAKDAPVTIIEYASMTCPHCARFEAETFPALKAKYIDTGKVRYIMREFPLDRLAAAAFMLARCAGPEKYNPLIETLFAQQQKWAVRDPLPPLLAIVKQAGFTEESFQSCINDTALLNKVQQMRDIGSRKFKVDSTPTFFINGERHGGELTIEQIDKIIAPMLKS
jgi:protein-disulfide isomerase